MRSTLLSLALAFSGALAQPTLFDPAFWEWHPPGPSDVRGPCPMLNTLTNHGFFPHSGKNFTKEITISALKRSLFLNESLSEFLYNSAMKTNPAPNATTFSLETLRTHDILEHDASLSRADAYWGNDYAFNWTVYEQTKSYWTASPITVQMAANARAARVATSNATNPTFGLTPTGLGFGFGETAAYILGLGDRVKGEVRRDVVEYLFEHERLPVTIGWTPPEEIISMSDLDDMINRIMAATPGAGNLKARGFHAGLMSDE